MTKEDRKYTLLLGLAHFFVDMTCTALLTARAAGLPYWQVTACAVLYNGLAFAFQPPIGALGDLLQLKRGLAALGCLLVTVGSLLPAPLATCIVIGLGNACFHIGGGREALKRGGSSAGIVGRFVAPGAIGIFLGPKLAKICGSAVFALPGILLLLAAALYLTRQAGKSAEAMTIPGLQLRRGKGILVCVCMFLTVLLRSYMGTVLDYPFLSEFSWGLVYALCIFGGKYCGGILADRFGTFRFCTGTQVLGTVLFMLSVRWPILAMPAIFLFNTTMAVTAARLYALLPAMPGTMFGLTTFALYLGVLPRLLGQKADFFHPAGLGVLSAVSAALLLAGLALSERRDCRGVCDV